MNDYNNNSVFISYSSDKRLIAGYLDEFLTINGLDVIRDEKEQDFYGFMEKIHECKTVVFLLNRSFFESIFCIYELLKWAEYNQKSGVEAIVANLCDIDFLDKSWLKVCHATIKAQEEKLVHDQNKEMKNVLESFDSFVSLIQRLSLIRRYQIDDINCQKSAALVYKAITGKNPEKELNEETKNRYRIKLHSLDKIRDIDLRMDLSGFLYDLMRGSFFRLNIIPENPFHDMTYKFLDYELGDTSTGAYVHLRVEDSNGKEMVVSIDDIDGVELNNHVSNNHLKYYFVIKDRRKVIEAIENGHEDDVEKERQTCTIIFNDGDALR